MAKALRASPSAISSIVSARSVSSVGYDELEKEVNRLSACSRDRMGMFAELGLGKHVIWWEYSPCTMHRIRQAKRLDQASCLPTSIPTVSA